MLDSKLSRASLRVGIVALGLLCSAGTAWAGAPESAGWPVTGGDPGGARFSPLADIDRANVARLEVAWTYHHGDFYDGGWLPHYRNKGTAMETTPILADGKLIFTTPMNRVIALDPETGKELWAFDPKIDTARIFANMIINRGVAHWRAMTGPEACASRLFLGTLDARLIAIDAATGKPCADFGTHGVVDLTSGVSPLTDSWEYNVTSPPTVVGEVVVVGSSIADLIRADAPPGNVRGFDARTGRLLWTFETLLPGTRGGAANVWTTMSADLARGLVYLPVSTVSPDFYGLDRPGANLYSDSLVALRAASGERVWHFQTVHHDLWDYDLAAPPNLIRLKRDGVTRDAVAQATKTGFVFVFDRETGEPLFPIEERPVPASDVPGENASATQPFPLAPPPLVPQRLTDADLWTSDPARLEACRARLAGLRNDGMFTPATERGSIVYPYTAGGANWSGAAWDESSSLLYVPVNNLVHVVRLVPLPDSNLGSDAVVLRNLWSAAYWFPTGRGTGLRYHTERWLFSEDGVPCNAPPWGWLVAVDLARGEIRWRVPVGENEEGVQGLSNFGPPLATAGGLVFHAGSTDLHLRAHDAATGEVLARFELPAGLHAGPITYKLRKASKQYLVIAPGGHVGLGSRLGDAVIAYALPD